MKPVRLRTLLTSMLRVGTIGFGGGAALIPVTENELVRRRGLLTPTQFGSHALIANLTPGALPVKLAALAGAELGRPFGALASACAVALPGALASVLLLAGFTQIGPAGIRFVEFAAVGITAFIILLLGHFILTVLRAAEARRKQTVAIVILSFLATGTPTLIHVAGRLLGQPWEAAVPRLSALGLVLVSITAIGLGHLLRHRPTTSACPGQNTRTPWIAAGICLIAALSSLAAGLCWPGGVEFLSLISLSSLTSFGGGEAYVAVADGFFVQSAMVSGAEFYGQAVPIANALPGPILIKIASSLGFSFGLETGGWPVAAAFAVGAFLISVAASAAPALALQAGHSRIAQSLFVRRLGTYILPVICGLLITTSLSMVEANLDLAVRAEVSPPAVGWATIAGVALLWWLQSRFRLHDLALLVLAGTISTLALLAVA